MVILNLRFASYCANLKLTHWGRVTHICVSKLTTIGSDNDLSPGRPQAIIWTNAGILLIGPLGINFSKILIEINTLSFNEMHLKMSSAKWHLFRLGLNELIWKDMLDNYKQDMWQLPEFSHHGGCWCPGAHMAPGHLQPPSWPLPQCKSTGVFPHNGESWRLYRTI